jgi:hypothetical protein
MTNDDFRVWLKGYFELADPGPLDMNQLQIIVNHLNLAEAVSGGLDAENQAIRAHIRQFRDKGQTDTAALGSLTAAVQKVLHLP